MTPNSRIEETVSAVEGRPLEEVIEDRDRLEKFRVGNLDVVEGRFASSRL